MYTITKLGQMVMKGVNCDTQYKNQVNMLLRAVSWVHNEKIRSYGLDRSQLDTQ